jgi:hypothetical protein
MGNRRLIALRIEGSAGESIRGTNLKGYGQHVISESAKCKSRAHREPKLGIQTAFATSLQTRAIE